MSERPWRPISERDSDSSPRFDALHQGVPAWLDGGLLRWILDVAAGGAQPMIYRLESRLREPLATPRDRQYGTQHTAPGILLQRKWQSGQDWEKLDLLDAVLADVGERAKGAAASMDNSRLAPLAAFAKSLETSLADGGSAWRVEADFTSPWMLVRRVGDAMTNLIQEVTQPDLDAARKIKSAWTACYGLHPDYDTAYRQAVLAVEALVIPVAVPKATGPTLGTAVAHIRDTVGKWSVGGLRAEQISSGATLLSMLKTLWHNQERHAHPDGSIRDVSQAEAEAVVSMAVTLVHWFTSGLVKKDDN